MIHKARAARGGLRVRGGARGGGGHCGSININTIYYRYRRA